MGASPVLPNQYGVLVSNSAISPGPRIQSSSPRTRRIPQSQQQLVRPPTNTGDSAADVQGGASTDTVALPIVIYGPMPQLHRFRVRLPTVHLDEAGHAGRR